MKADKYNDFVSASVKLQHQKLYERYQTWYSSAQLLEQALLEIGIKLPNKLYYEYKFPDGKINREYYDEKHEKWNFVMWYENAVLGHSNVKRAIYYNKRFDMSDLFYFCISLTLANNKKLKQDLEKKYLSFKKELDGDIEKIVALNPELATVQDHNNRDFLMGCMYGFAPAEIDYFIKLVNHRFERKKTLRTWDKVFQEEHASPEDKKREKIWGVIYKLCGRDVGYILAPETVDMIEKETDKYIIRQRIAANERG